MYIYIQSLSESSRIPDISLSQCASQNTYLSLISAHGICNVRSLRIEASNDPRYLVSHISEVPEISQPVK